MLSLQPEVKLLIHNVEHFIFPAYPATTDTADWLKTHKQGPLEAVWHKLTWAFSASNSK